MLKTVQACRGGAALLVLVFHTSYLFAMAKYFHSQPFGRVFDFGWAGVDLFFVLSGFIILHAHRADLGRPERLPRYLIRRTQRIYPTYWAVLLLITPVFFLVPSFGDGSQRDPGVIVRSVLLIPQFYGAPVLGVAWSLVFEMFFYLVFALLLIRRWLGITAFATWFVLLCVGRWPAQYPFDFLGHEYHFRFFAGLMVGEVTHRWRIPAPRLVAVAGLALFLGTGSLSVHTNLIGLAARSAGLTLGSALLLAGLVAWERTGLVQVPRLLLFLGDASYSIYLVHYPVLSALSKATTAARLHTVVPHGVLFVAFVGVATAAGALFHVAVERPLRAIGRVKTGAQKLRPSREAGVRRAA